MNESNQIANNSNKQHRHQLRISEMEYGAQRGKGLRRTLFLELSGLCAERVEAVLVRGHVGLEQRMTLLEHLDRAEVAAEVLAGQLRLDVREPHLEVLEVAREHLLLVRLLQVLALAIRLLRQLLPQLVQLGQALCDHVRLVLARLDQLLARLLDLLEARRVRLHLGVEVLVLLTLGYTISDKTMTVQLPVNSIKCNTRCNFVCTSR